METIEHKVCFLCKESKPKYLFRKDIQKKDGLSPRCKSCIDKPKVIIDYSKITEKKCASCGIIKDYSLYHKNTKNGRATVQSKCKECATKYKKRRYWKNHDEELKKHTKSRTKPENVLQRKQYYVENKEDYQKRHKKYFANQELRLHKNELAKIRYRKNIEKVRLQHKINYLKPENAEKRRAAHHFKKQNDVAYLIKRRLRFRLRHIVKALGNNNFKYKSAVELLGCNMTEFKVYIENLFKEGMSWEGVINGSIHLDHKKPCAKFDLTKLEEQKKCFHYSNIQPLWKVDNLRKGSFYQEEKITA